MEALERLRPYRKPVIEALTRVLDSYLSEQIANAARALKRRNAVEALPKLKAKLRWAWLNLSDDARNQQSIWKTSPVCPLPLHQPKFPTKHCLVPQTPLPFQLKRFQAQQKHLRNKNLEDLFWGANLLMSREEIEGHAHDMLDFDMALLPQRQIFPIRFE